MCGNCLLTPSSTLENVQFTYQSSLLKWRHSTPCQFVCLLKYVDQHTTDKVDDIIGDDLLQYKSLLLIEKIKNVTLSSSNMSNHGPLNHIYSLKSQLFIIIITTEKKNVNLQVYMEKKVNHTTNNKQDNYILLLSRHDSFINQTVTIEADRSCISLFFF